MLEQFARSLLPVAEARGNTTRDRAGRTFAEVASDAAQSPDEPFLWPILVSAWPRKPA